MATGQLSSGAGSRDIDGAGRENSGSMSATAVGMFRSDRNWKLKLLDWLFAQGAIAVVLSAWLGWTIYDGTLKEKAAIEAARARQEWEQKLADRIDARFTVIMTDFRTALQMVIADSRENAQRQETRIDRMIDGLKNR